MRSRAEDYGGQRVVSTKSLRVVASAQRARFVVKTDFIRQNFFRSNTRHSFLYKIIASETFSLKICTCNQIENSLMVQNLLFCPSKLRLSPAILAKVGRRRRNDAKRARARRASAFLSSSEAAATF